MTHYSKKLASCFLLAAALAAGCSDPAGGPELVQVDPPSTVFPDEESPEGPACEPFDLCTRTVEECEIDITLDQCEDWYADEANCEDMDGYLECNCACLTEATCDDYFSCGELCFEDFCAA